MSACGTTAGYRRHRADGETPCQPCRNAHAVYFREYRTRLDVTCWCEAKTVRVSKRDVLAGVTRSCGRSGCGPERMAS